MRIFFGSRARVRASFVLALLSCAPSPAFPDASGIARKGLLFAAGPQSRLWLEGDSTLHAYSSTATVLAVSGEADLMETNLSLMSLAQTGAIRNLEVAVDVKGLKSGKRGLDDNMYESLRVEKHPKIVFRMAGYEVRPRAVGQGRLLIVAKGTLSVAGREKEIVLEAEMAADPSGIRITGSRELRMTDFGIKPPSMLLGALKTDDRVVVNFDLVLDVRDESGTARRKQP